MEERSPGKKQEAGKTSGNGTTAWPFPLSPLQHDPLNPPPLSGHGLKQRRATPTFGDMMTETGEATW